MVDDPKSWDVQLCLPTAAGEAKASSNLDGWIKKKASFGEEKGKRETERVTTHKDLETGCRGEATVHHHITVHFLLQQVLYSHDSIG